MSVVEIANVKRVSGTLQEELTVFMELRKLNNADICRATGIKPATFSLWKSGKYGAKTDNIDQIISSFLGREKERRNSNGELPYSEISASKDVFEVAQTCHLSKKIGVIVAPPGIGKTTAIKQYKAENPDSILLEVVNGAKKPLMKKLNKALGLGGAGTYDDLLDSNIEALTNSGRLVIIDEAELLSLDILDVLRRIYDVSNKGFGLLLVGIPELISNIRGKKHKLARLNSRVSVFRKLEHLDQEDVAILVKSVIPNASDELVRAFYDASYCNTRNLANYISMSIEVAEVYHCEVTPKIIAEVLREMRGVHR